MHTVLLNSNKTWSFVVDEKRRSFVVHEKRRSFVVDEKRRSFVVHENRRSFVVDEKGAKLERTISLTDVPGLQQLGVLQHNRQDHRLDAGFPVAVFALVL